MVVTCEINFDGNPFGTYFAGQMLSGTATLKVDKPKDVKAILLKISGSALTKWTEKSFSKRQLFYGGEDYMATQTYLMGSEEDQRYTLPSGIHSYTFACQLPHNCPSSFEGQHGYIRYVAKVVLIRPWKFNQTYSRGFTVLKMLDLNDETSQLMMPSNSENYKTFCCGPFRTEPLKMELHLPQTGFVPGQSIPITMLIINNTNIMVSDVKFSLVMLIRYFSQHPEPSSQVERIVVTEVKGNSVSQRTTCSISKNLYIPATPTTTLSLCNLIKITYQIEVEAIMKGWYSSQTITMPVTIGNVPICKNNTIIQRQPVRNENIGREMQSVTSPNDLYTNMPASCYEESRHTVRGDINEDELHSFGPCEFAPLYPVYIPQGSIDITCAPTVTSTDAPPSSTAYDNPNFQS